MPVADAHLGHVHQVRDHPLHHLDRARRAGHDPGAQRGPGRSRREPGRAELGDEHGRVRRRARCTARRRPPRASPPDRMPGSGDHHARAVTGGGQVSHDHAEAVIEGHRHADPVGLGVAADLPDEIAVVEDVVVGQGGALRWNPVVPEVYWMLIGSSKDNAALRAVSRTSSDETDEPAATSSCARTARRCRSPRAGPGRGGGSGRTCSTMAAVLAGPR